MIPEELKQMLALSGGKMIVSEGSVKDSYVVMRMNDYLEEAALIGKKQKKEESKLLENVENKAAKDEISTDESLTDEELLDRINADIAQLRQRNTEKELEDALSDESKELNYDYV